jgi:hypothetical protein
VHFDKGNLERRAWISRDEQLAADSCYLNIELFTKLAPRRFEIALTGFQLASWKLPESTVPLVRWSAT